MNEGNIPRRGFLAAGPLMLAGCRAADGEYFGRTRPPSDQRLICENGFEPDTLDPALSIDIWEAYIVHALFEGLTTYHPRTAEPMAALATHYEVDVDGTRFTFYFRGHPNPRGHKLPNTNTLRGEYREGKLSQDLSRGLSAPPDAQPARWSDGKMITAVDLVYSWRRAVDPATVAPRAYLMSCIQNADAVMTGRVRPDQLGVEAVDAFSLQVNLQARTPFFLQLTSHRIFCAVPPHAIEAARRSGREFSWTEPRHIVTSGPFTLQEWRPYHRVVVTRNQHYYESELVARRQISFLPVVDGATAANLYKAGEADSTPVLLPQLMPLLARKRDFHRTPAFGTAFVVFNTTRPPFDNVFLRYALNMATEKAPVADFIGGRAPTTTLIPNFEGYRPPATVPVCVDGKIYDALSFNPEGARRMLAKAGFPDGIGSDGRRLKVEISLPSAPDTQPEAEILQQQWRHTLGVDVTLVNQELKVWLQTVFSQDYKGVATFADWGAYVDPIWFLNRFKTGADTMSTGWTDPRFDVMVSRANAIAEEAVRMQKLSECEEYLLRAMPVIPLFRWVWCRLQKPYVRGLESNLLDARRFKYAWIDTNWRPS